MKLQTYRAKHGLSVSAFAKIAGLNQSTAWRADTGKVNPSGPTALKIERATGGEVTFKDLVNEAQ